MFVSYFEYFRCLVSKCSDQREVRCKSVATIITVIEYVFRKNVFISRNTHQANANGIRGRILAATAFLDMKSVAVFSFARGDCLSVLTKDCYAFLLFCDDKKAFFVA